MMCIYFFHIHRNRKEMYYYQKPITIRIVLRSLKDQIAANAVCRQLRDLSNKIAVTLQPIFVSKITGARS